MSSAHHLNDPDACTAGRVKPEWNSGSTSVGSLVVLLRFFYQHRVAAVQEVFKQAKICEGRELRLL